MDFNYLAILVATVVPIVVGYIWYHPKVFGITWLRAAEMTEAKMKNSNVIVIFGISLVLSFILAFFTNFLVIHEFGVYGMTEGQMDGATTQAFMDEWAGKYRSYKHGALHGAMAGVMFALPVIGITALFERRSGKYILIHCVYWILCLAIMGSIIAGWTA